MAVKTILRKKEAVIFSNVPKKEMPVCDVQDIFQVEQSERRNCLGKDFYEELLLDVIDYSTVEEFVKGTAYVVGNLVLYNGCYYVVIQNTTQEPSKKSDWDLAPKFTSTDYEEFWCGFLGRYLSLIVIRDTIQPQAAQLTGAGVIKVNGQNFEPVSEGDRGNGKVGLYNWVDAQIGRCYKNMHEWLIEQIEGGSMVWDNYRRASEAKVDDNGLACCGGGVWDEGKCECVCKDWCECDSCVSNKRMGSNTWAVA